MFPPDGKYLKKLQNQADRFNLAEKVPIR